MKSGNLNFLEPSGPLQACNGTALPYRYYYYYYYYYYYWWWWWFVVQVPFLVILTQSVLCSTAGHLLVSITVNDTCVCLQFQLSLVG